LKLGMNSVHLYGSLSLYISIPDDQCTSRVIMRTPEVEEIIAT